MPTMKIGRRTRVQRRRAGLRKFAVAVRAGGLTVEMTEEVRAFLAKHPDVARPPVHGKRILGLDGLPYEEPTFEERLIAYGEAHPSWGWLHVVMADGNLDTDCVEECMNGASKAEDSEAFWLAAELWVRSDEQREDIYRRLG